MISLKEIWAGVKKPKPIHEENENDKRLKSAKTLFYTGLGENTNELSVKSGKFIKDEMETCCYRMINADGTLANVIRYENDIYDYEPAAIDSLIQYYEKLAGAYLKDLTRTEKKLNHWMRVKQEQPHPDQQG